MSNTERKPVDVLAVMGEAYVTVHPQQASLRDDLSEARAAVAELIEALRAERDELRGVDNGTLPGHSRSRGERIQAMTAALARCGVQS